jgi:hypothetical protein
MARRVRDLLNLAVVGLAVGVSLGCQASSFVRFLAELPCLGLFVRGGNGEDPVTVAALDGVRFSSFVI